MPSDSYLRKIYVQGDRIMLVVVWIMCLNSVAMAGWAAVDALQTASSDAKRALDRSEDAARRSLEHGQDVDSVPQVIAKSTATISELNASIVSAADQYKAATANVLHGIQLIRDAASLTVHETERTSSAAQEMQMLSEEMESSVGQFRCDEPPLVLPGPRVRPVRSRALTIAGAKA